MVIAAGMSRLHGTLRHAVPPAMVCQWCSTRLGTGTSRWLHKLAHDRNQTTNTTAAIWCRPREVMRPIIRRDGGAKAPTPFSTSTTRARRKRFLAASRTNSVWQFGRGRLPSRKRMLLLRDRVTVARPSREMRSYSTVLWTRRKSTTWLTNGGSRQFFWPMISDDGYRAAVLPEAALGRGGNRARIRRLQISVGRLWRPCTLLTVRLRSLESGPPSRRVTSRQVVIRDAVTVQQVRGVLRVHDVWELINSATPGICLSCSLPDSVRLTQTC